MNNGYAICFNEWALDKDIKNELGLLLIISSLCAEKGYCYANNAYLASIFDIDEVSISRKLKKLINKNYITIDYKKSGSVIISREIRLTKMLTAVNKNVKENNTIYNKKEIDNNKLLSTKKRQSFVKPTLQEVQEYCSERNNNIDAQHFIDYYESIGWVVGYNKPMKDWRACVRTWEKNNKINKNSSNDNWHYEIIDGINTLIWD